MEIEESFQLTTKQQQFYDLAMEGKSVVLEGKAGTGKSYVTQLTIEALKDKGRNVVAVAPTGVAANNIGGQTIHSLFSLPIYGVIDYEACSFVRKAKRRVLEKIDTIFIDEISMCRADILDGMHWTLKKNGCRGLDEIQVICIGDMKQLPPIADDNFKSVMLQKYKGVEFFYSYYMNRNQDKVYRIDLDEVKRQSDLEFIENLNIVREGKQSSYFKKFLSDEPKGIVLAPHNSTVSRYNAEGLARINGKEYIFKAEVEGKLKPQDFNFEEIIHVKDGAKIMYLVNSKNNNLVNGTIGIFRENEGQFFIEADGNLFLLEPVKVTKKEYVLDPQTDKLELEDLGSLEQMPIKLAYALSIHKAQGLTFDEVSVDLSLPCFAPGQLYVALSRVKTPEGLRIILGNRKLKNNE